MARQIIIAGNWKMNLLPNEAEDLVSELKERLANKKNLEVVVIPQSALIPLAQEWVIDSSIRLGAQNSSDQMSGAFTGETSPELLKILGCRYCLAGHSERREIFGETDEQVGKKANAQIEMGLIPIICVGETLAERESGKHFEVIDTQVRAVFNQIDKESWTKIVFAYEPVWAIGTGKTATPAQANQVHRHLRSLIGSITGEVVANATSILYGGSAKPSNAADLLAKSDIDGLLVGGASLKAEDFSRIISSF